MHETVESNVTYGRARVLLGWMDTDQALRSQYGWRGDVEFSAAASERLARARDRVAARPAGVDQREIAVPLPGEFASYGEELQRHPSTAASFSGGWGASLVDLRRLCAFQSRVYTERADERVRSLDPKSLHSIATVSLPTPAAANIPAFFDPKRGVWVITSSDPNLKVVGHFYRGETEAAGFGFSVSLGTSSVTAAEYRGRYYLMDGYHRAVAFLRRGITHVPALTRRLRDDEPFTIPPGALPASTYLGERPPQLADFLEDDVSMSVDLPLFRKVIIVQAVEVMA